MASSTSQNFQKYLIDLPKYDGLYIQHLLFVDWENLHEAATTLELDKVKKIFQTTPNAIDKIQYFYVLKQLSQICS